MGAEHEFSPEGEERNERLKPKPFKLEIITADDPRSAWPRAVEAEVLGEAFGNTPEQIAEEYDPYEAATEFICVTDPARERAAGMFRVIHNSEAGLKTVDDIADPEGPWHESLADAFERNGLSVDLDRALDVGVVAIGRDYRGSEAPDIAYGLYRGICAYAAIHEYTHLVGIMDVNVLHYTKVAMGRPFKTLEGLEPAEYIGSAQSVPVYAPVAEIGAALRTGTDQNFYRKCIAGEDIESVAVPEELKGVKLHNED